MNDILELLEEKNNCLKKFYDLNTAELQNIKSGAFDHLERFYQTREDILILVKKIDELIGLENQSEQSMLAPSTADRLTLDELFKQKDHLIKNILAQDLELMTIIEAEKSEIIKALRSTKVARKLLAAYGA